MRVIYIIWAWVVVTQTDIASVLFALTEYLNTKVHLVTALRFGVVTQTDIGR